jgi:2,3-bisphosphoglycerate-dependent phosphoglycerate mutase
VVKRREIEVVFETHSISEDNESGVASGWNPGHLSDRGRELARELGTRRRHDGIEAVFASDLQRAVETASLAFQGSGVPIFLDWRLRECNYGEWNGQPASHVHGNRLAFLDSPYPGGESWRQAVGRVGTFFRDLPIFWPAKRVLLIGHVATRWGCETILNDNALEHLIAEEFIWQEGWEYILKRDESLRAQP